MKAVTVMPFIVPEFKNRCLDRCKIDNLLLVDNTRNNLGIMRSHNLGIDAMRDLDADWLVVMSAAIRFGADGGLDFIAALEDGGDVVNCTGLFGWHLMAFSRAILDKVGRWDEHYTPYGLDDNDLAIRVRKADPAAVWRGVRANVTDTIMAHSIKRGGVHAPYAPRLAYFVSKWGHPPGFQFADYNDHPFNRADLDIGYWDPINGAEWDKPAPPTEQAYFR